MASSIAVAWASVASSGSPAPGERRTLNVPVAILASFALVIASLLTAQAPPPDDVVISSLNYEAHPVEAKAFDYLDVKMCACVPRPVSGPELSYLQTMSSKDVLPIRARTRRRIRTG